MEPSERDPYRPTGKRHYISDDEHRTWNFLTHYPGSDNKISFKDSPDLTGCKFGKGFKRRSVDKIFPNREENRIKQWENAIKRRQNMN